MLKRCLTKGCTRLHAQGACSIFLAHISKRRFVTPPERITLMRQLGSAVRWGRQEYANEIGSLSPRGAAIDHRH